MNKLPKGWTEIFRAMIAAVFMIAASSSVVAQQQLPPEVRADIIFQEITSAIALNRPSEALTAISRYRKIGIKTPPKLLFVEAKLAFLTSDYKRSQQAIEEYLRSVNSQDPNYASAIRLYPEITKKAGEALEAARVAVFSQQDELVSRRRQTQLACLSRNRTALKPPQFNTSSQPLQRIIVSAQLGEKSPNESALPRNPTSVGTGTSQCWDVSGRDLAILSDDTLLSKSGISRLIKEANDAAKNGDAVAAFLLGVALRSGAGVHLNLAEAVAFFRLAADAGLGRAQAELGFMYQEGAGGLPESFDKAMEWYQRAIASGDTRSIGHISFRYQHGNGPEQDLGKALLWKRRGAEAGDSLSMYSLGIDYRYGAKGAVTEDPVQAAQWYRRAGDAGYGNAAESLADLYVEGKGVAVDQAAAVRWYGRAMESYRILAALGDASSMMKIAYLYHEGKGVPKNAAEAALWYSRAIYVFRREADLGNVYAMRALIWRYDGGYDGATKDVAEAERWKNRLVASYRSAAEAGDTFAMREISVAYRSQYTKQDRTEALSWLKRAAAAGSDRAANYAAVFSP